MMKKNTFIFDEQSGSTPFVAEVDDKARVCPVCNDALKKGQTLCMVRYGPNWNPQGPLCPTHKSCFDEAGRTGTVYHIRFKLKDTGQVIDRKVVGDDMNDCLKAAQAAVRKEYGDNAGGLAICGPQVSGDDDDDPVYCFG